MENRLEIEKRREFGEIIADGFTLIKENLSLYFKSYAIYVLPFMILMGYSYGNYFSKLMKSITNPEEMLGSGMIVFLITLMLSSILGYLLLYLIAFGMVLLNKKTAEAVDFEKIKEFIGANFGKVFIGGLLLYLILIVFMVVLIIPMTISPGLGAVVFFLGMFFMFYMMINWTFTIVIMVDKGTGFAESLSASRELVRDNWWSTFGLIIVSSLIIALIGQLVSLPFMAIAGISAFSGLEEGTEVSPFLTAIVSMITFGITGFLQFYTVNCLMLKYIDLEVKKHGSSTLKDDIDSFGEDNDGIFENEGEY